MACGVVVEALFDFALQVLGPEAHTEGLAGEGQASVHQGLEGIPGGMSHRQHQRLTGQRPCGGVDAGQNAVAGVQAGEGGVEPHFAPQGLNLLADGGNDAPQQVGAHMGLLLPGDFRRRTVGQKDPCDVIAQGVPDAGGELAVRKGTGAALAKLNVGVFVQLTGGGEVFHRPDPVFQSGAPLQDNGGKPLLGQGQGCKQPRRPQAADHRPGFQGLGAGSQHQLRLLAQSNAGQGPCIGRFLTLIFERYCNGIDELGPAVAGVHRQAGHPHLPDLALGQAQQVQRLGTGLLLSGGEGQADISNQDHVLVFPFLL